MLLHIVKLVIDVLVLPVCHDKLSTCTCPSLIRQLYMVSNPKHLSHDSKLMA